ncbi:MAG TPA: tetratricopeptide repeat protein [Armatimonadaceae bacterium]|jgi:tetratricopeptide (TPR) repeat protein|nr:tetratricopeptide repeat protein [Armatimonadaceae bacterium]
MNESVWRNGEEHPETARLLAKLAAVYGLQEKVEDAIPLLRRAISLMERQPSAARNEDLPRLMGELAELHIRVGQYDEADDARSRALALREAIFGEMHPSVARSLDDLALVRKARGKIDEACDLHRRALRIWEATCGVGSPEVARCLTHIASVYIEEKRYADAEPLLERAVSVWQRTTNQDDLYSIVTLSCYGDLYRNTGRPDEAQGMELLAKAIVARHYKEN